MSTLKYGSLTYTVHHAVKGDDYIRCYDALGRPIVSFEGVDNFEDFEYDDNYMTPEQCFEESCNDVKFFNDDLRTRDGRSLGIGKATEQAIAVERARIDELVAMHGEDIATHTFNIGKFKGTIYPLGAVAFIELEVTGEIEAGSGVGQSNIFPDDLKPLRTTGLALLADTTSVDCLDLRSNITVYEDGTCAVYVYNFGAETFNAKGVKFGGLYPLGETYIPELADMRVDAFGNTHETAGEALRSQIKTLNDKIGSGSGGGGAGTASIDDSKIGGDAWSSKNTVDKLCPAFSESGSVVTCQPVEGYPLSVVSQIQPMQEGEGDPRPNGPNLIADMPYQNESEWYLDDVTQFYIFDVGYSFNDGQYRFSGSTGYEVMLVVNNPELADWQVVKTFSGTFDEVVELTHLDKVDYGMIGLAFDPGVIESSSLADVIATLDGLRLEKGTGGNIRPITGHSEAKLWRGGKNLIDYTKAIGRYNKNAQPSQTVNIIENGIEWVSGDYYFTIPCNIKAGETVTFSCVDEANAFTSFYLADNKTEKYCSKSGIITTSSAITAAATVTVTADADTIFIYKTNPGDDIVEPLRLTNLQLEYGTTATPYEPYRGEAFTIDLGQTVYGGSYNWQTGELTINTLFKELAVKDMDNTDDYPGWKKQSWAAEVSNMVAHKRYEIPCNINPSVCINQSGDVYFTSSDIGAMTQTQLKKANPDLVCQFVFSLLKPVTVRFSPQEILALSGENALYSDTGDTQVSGKADPNAIIADLYEKIKALQTAAVNNA